MKQKTADTISLDGIISGVAKDTIFERDGVDYKQIKAVRITFHDNEGKTYKPLFPYDGGQFSVAPLIPLLVDRHARYQESVSHFMLLPDTLHYQLTMLEGPWKNMPLSYMKTVQDNQKEE